MLKRIKICFCKASNVLQIVPKCTVNFTINRLASPYDFGAVNLLRTQFFCSEEPARYWESKKYEKIHENASDIRLLMWIFHEYFTACLFLLLASIWRSEMRCLKHSCNIRSCVLWNWKFAVKNQRGEQHDEKSFWISISCWLSIKI